jgi:hypothetical protein
LGVAIYPLTLGVNVNHKLNTYLTVKLGLNLRPALTLTYPLTLSDNVSDELNTYLTVNR